MNISLAQCSCIQAYLGDNMRPFCDNVVCKKQSCVHLAMAGR